MGKILGVDLGTSNSAAAVMLGGRPAIIPSAEGSTIGGKAFPSVVAFAKDDELLVGEPARRQAVSNPEGTIFAIKRRMGEDYNVKINGKEYSPQQISAHILKKIHRDAEVHLSDKITEVVITVPAYFNDNQRQATKDAGEIAGLKVTRIINEPTAAALAYGLDKVTKNAKIMVFDLGGGTFDVTIMEFGDGVFEVKSTSGDTKLGGTDMDLLLYEYIVSEFKKQTGVDLNNDSVAAQRVKEEAEKVKIELSTVPSRDINLPYITADNSGPKHLNMTINRAKLEELISPIVERCRGPVVKALEDAKLKPQDVDKIVLVGGPTRMPIVSKLIQDVTGKEPERGIDPMECVALGAAIQGGIISGDVKDILLLDVTPISLGIETLGSVFTKIIDRNTTIPTKKTQIFSTAADNQTAVTVSVSQGERAMVKDNISLGTFNLEGIPPAPRGLPQIEVSFDIDANGILKVTAKDLATKKEQNITITASTKLSDEEKERMIKDAERFADEDKKNKEQIELINNSDSLIYTCEKTITDLKDKIKEEDKKKIELEIKELKEAVAAKHYDVLKSKNDSLSKLIQEIGAAVYQDVAKQQAAQEKQKTKKQSKTDNSTNSEEDKNKDAVDVDYKVVDEDNNPDSSKVVNEDNNPNSSTS